MFVVTDGTCLSTVNAEPVGTIISALMLSSDPGLSALSYAMAMFACSPSSMMSFVCVGAPGVVAPDIGALSIHVDVTAALNAPVTFWYVEDVSTHLFA